MAIDRETLRENDANVAATLEHLADLQRRLRRYAAAKESYQGALAVRRRILPANHPEIGRNLNNLAAVQWALRDALGARNSFAEAAQFFRAALPKDHPPTAKDLLAVAASLSNLGGVESHLGDYMSARKNLDEALDIFRNSLPKNHPAIAAALNNLGAAQQELRDYESARKSNEDALAIRRAVRPPNPIDVAQSLTNLGNAQHSLGDDRSACESHREALALRRSVLPKTHPDVAKSLHALGLAQHHLRDEAAARASLSEALAIRRQSLPKNHPDVARVLLNLGSVEYYLHDYASARTSTAEALAIFRQALPTDHPEIALTLANLGLLDLVAGKADQESVARLEEAVDLYQRKHLRLAISQAEREQLATAVESHWALSLLLSAALAAKSDPGPVYDRVLRVKGGVTAQQRWAHQARDISDPGTRKRLEQLRQINEQFVTLSLSRGNTPLTQRLTRERADLERQLSEQSEAYRGFEARSRIDADQIRSVLPAHGALVDFVEYTHVAPVPPGQEEPRIEERLLAFVARPDHSQVTVVSLGPSSTLPKRIDDWRASYVAGQLRAGASTDLAKGLREQLWRPVEEHLKGTQLVYLSPDGPLNGLPWAALPTAQPDRFLLEDYAFCTIPVPQLLPELLKKNPAREENPALCAVGNVAFGGQSDSPVRAGSTNRFVDLPGAAAEVRAARDAFQTMFPHRPSDLLTGKNATKQAFVTHAPKCSCLVVCTHGFFLSDSEGIQQNARAAEGFLVNRRQSTVNPAVRSGLVFAGAGTAPDGKGSSFLTALEASELDLRHVELAVLSACDTGVGTIIGGEGVLGLQRAFQVAGARNVVATLWEVDDQATAALMRLFYHKLWAEKKTPMVALREAQLWILHSSAQIPALAAARGVNFAKVVQLPNGARRDESPRWTSPYLWAGFVIAGGGQ